MKKGFKWNLNDILPVGKFDSLYSEIERDLVTIKRMYKSLSPAMPAKKFAGFIEFDEKLSEKISRLYDLGHLMESADEKSSEAKLLKERAKDLHVKISREMEIVAQWLKGKNVKDKRRLDDRNAKRLFKSVPDLEYVLNFARESAKHTLTENEENILTEKTATGESVLVGLRELLETEFVYTLKLPGKKPQEFKTRGEIAKFFHNPNPKARQAAYEAVFEKYKENLDKFFIIYQAVVKNWGNTSKLRAYKSPIAMRNHRNHITDKPIEVLLDVCSKNRKIFQNYFLFKAKELKMRQITRFDLYAPIVKPQNHVAHMPFSDAVKLVLETFEEFSPQFAKHAKRIINSMHIDSHPRPFKRGGAFCATVSPSIAPYILLNYAGSPRDISTLAHELGHGVHSLYASEHSISSQHANLPLAETASTLGEMILFEKLLKRCKSRREKKALLSEKLADTYATVIRQNYFVKFEIEAHKAISYGVTAEALSNIYLKNLKEQFGASVKIDPIFRYEWAGIPHIVNSPFYCYAYNFGELLSLALFKRYKDEGLSFVPKIEKILAYGGSEDPDKILKEVGIDISSPKFWQGSFEIIKNWQKELENCA